MYSQQFTTIDRVISGIRRDLNNVNINVMDIVEWAGEALDFLKIPASLENVVTFAEVKNYETNLPEYLHYILQIARDSNYTSLTNFTNYEEEVTVEVNNEVSAPCTDCQGNIIGDYDIAYYRPFFNLYLEHELWTNSKIYKRRYTPVRLAESVFFKSTVCQEKQVDYTPCKDEYTIIGLVNRKLRFSFKEGYVAISYLRNAIDKETGFPYIPDEISVITAIKYYIKWKLAESLDFDGREGFARLAQDSERKWLKYIRQGRNALIMPKTIDEYQNLLEQSHYLIPRGEYYNFFGTLNS